MLPHLYLQSHRNRFEQCHTLVDILGRESELGSDSSTDDGVLDGSIIDKRNGEAILYTFIYIGDDAHALLLLNLLDIERSLRVLERPEEFLAFIIRIFSHHLGNYLIIAIINHGFSIMEEDELLTALLLQGREVLLMGRTHIGKNSDGRLDDVTESKHLARLTDTRLEDTYLGLLVHQPDRQWHTYLRIVTARAAGNEHAWREQLIEPLLDHRLAVGTRNTHDRDIEFITMTLSQTLKSLQRIDHLQEVSLRIIRSITLRDISYHKVFHTSAIQFRDVVMTIIALRLECKKQSFLWETK